MADDVSGLAAELNESAARSERDRNARVDQAAAEHARRFADAELAAARLNDAAREVARAASESMPETTTTKRFMRSPKVVTAYRSSFFLDHVKLTPYFEYHRVSIDVRDGFAMRWNDPDARDRGGVDIGPRSVDRQSQQRRHASATTCELHGRARHTAEHLSVAVTRDPCTSKPTTQCRWRSTVCTTAPRWFPCPIHSHR